MMKKVETFYVSPQIRVIKFANHAVLCLSGEPSCANESFIVLDVNEW